MTVVVLVLVVLALVGLAVARRLIAGPRSIRRIPTSGGHL